MLSAYAPGCTTQVPITWPTGEKPTDLIAWCSSTESDDVNAASSRIVASRCWARNGRRPASSSAMLRASSSAGLIPASASSKLFGISGSAGPVDGELLQR